LRHISDEALKTRLPGVVELVRNFARLDAKTDLIPVAPSAHYTMGGIPTNLNCDVLDGENEVFGLMAIGEAACVSVHGANRLGCNSLLDLIVFGKIAGKKAAEKLARKVAGKLVGRASDLASTKIEKLRKIFISGQKISLSALKKQLQENNEKNLGVFREAELLKSGLAKSKELFEIFKNHRITNQSLVWNDELIAYLELKNLFLNSLAANFSALNRCESRGAHYRSDFQNRDDQNFFAHSLVRLAENELQFSLKPVRCESKISELNLIPQPRKY
jgi:succinate dehydrogenase / fumarate reductase flavoprotein subunit